jgi:hypothetical protein
MGTVSPRPASSAPTTRAIAMSALSICHSHSRFSPDHPGRSAAARYTWSVAHFSSQLSRLLRFTLSCGACAPVRLMT